MATLGVALIRFGLAVDFFADADADARVVLTDAAAALATLA